MNKIQISLTTFEANGNICPLPLLCWLLKPHFWWIPEVWLCMSCSFLILRVHVSQSQYDKNLSLFMWDMCMLSWLVRWIGWPFESDICVQSPVKFFFETSKNDKDFSLCGTWPCCPKWYLFTLAKVDLAKHFAGGYRESLPNATFGSGKNSH